MIIMIQKYVKGNSTNNGDNKNFKVVLNQIFFSFFPDTLVIPLYDFQSMKMF